MSSGPRVVVIFEKTELQALASEARAQGMTVPEYIEWLVSRRHVSGATRLPVVHETHPYVEK